VSHVSQIGFDGAAAFASAMLELAAVAPDRSLVQGAGAAERRGRGGYPERPRRSASKRAGRRHAGLSAARATLKRERETEEKRPSYGPSGRRGVLSQVPPASAKKNHDRGCTMSDEFDNLDANEAASESTLYRCRALAGRIGEELRKKKPEHFVDEGSLADFHASLEHAADVLSTVKGSQAQGRQQHR
jgi:hypothetical protein